MSRTNDLSAPVPYPQDYPQAEKTATAVLEQVNAMLDKAAEPKPAPESVTVRSVPGSPSVEILTTAAAMDADVIVLGSRGAGGFAKLVMGSVSAQVAQHAHCPGRHNPVGRPEVTGNASFRPACRCAAA